jgi:hypothetical protein
VGVVFHNVAHPVALNINASVERDNTRSVRELRPPLHWVAAYCFFVANRTFHVLFSDEPRSNPAVESDSPIKPGEPLTFALGRNPNCCRKLVTALALSCNPILQATNALVRAPYQSSQPFLARLVVGRPEVQPIVGVPVLLCVVLVLVKHVDMNNLPVVVLRDQQTALPPVRAGLALDFKLHRIFIRPYAKHQVTERAATFNVSVQFIAYLVIAYRLAHVVSS